MSSWSARSDVYDNLLSKKNVYDNRQQQPSDRCQAYPRIWADAAGFAFAWYVDGHGAAKFLSNFRSKIFTFRISYMLLTQQTDNLGINTRKEEQQWCHTGEGWLSLHATLTNEVY